MACRSGSTKDWPSTYSTFLVDAAGTGALIGRAIPAHLDLLTHRRHLTIPELLAVDADSSAYNEGERQTLFYAQSWALVHMLVSGSPNRSSLLAQYGRLVAGGTPSLEAWHQVFKDAPIARELQRYVGRESMSGFRYRFDKSIPTVKSYSSRVSEGDAQAVLGDLLRRVAEAPETAARFEKAIALQPVSARALALYGLLRLDEDEPDKALPLLMAAAKDKTDWLVQYHVATGLTRVITTTDDPDPAVIATAREALSIAQAARPDLANGYALAARLDTAEGTNATQALQSIRRARTVSPGRDDYILLEAFIRMRLGEYVAARQLLTPLTTARNTASIRANAQEVLEQVALLERETEEFMARLEGQKVETAGPAGQRRQGSGLPRTRARRIARRGTPRTDQLRRQGNRDRGQRGRHHRTLCRRVAERRRVHQPPRRPAQHDRLHHPHAARSRLRHVARNRPAVTPTPGDRGGVPATPR